MILLLYVNLMKLYLLFLDVSDFKYVLMLIYHPSTSSSQKNTEFVESFTLKLRMVQRLKDTGVGGRGF